MSKPYTFELSAADATMTRYDKHIQRHLSAMAGQYHDVEAYAKLLAAGDIELYQVYENTRPSAAGELPHGLSILHPGRVGDEYFMTKGHFHRVLETGEVYHCLKGHGMIVMETPEGEWAVEELTPGRVLYVPPRWAHRSVNIGDRDDLVTFFVYPGNAGHDYGTIEQKGFRKLVLAGADGPEIVDNPRWKKEVRSKD